MRKKRLKHYISIFLGIVILVSFSACRKENEASYFNKSTTNVGCDTTYITFSKHIKPMFDSKCISCHVGGSSGGCDLDTYEKTVTYVTSHQPVTKLYDYVKDMQNPHEGVIMDSCELKQLSKWVLYTAP
jgi:hypothetical protein